MLFWKLSVCLFSIVLVQNLSAQKITEITYDDFSDKGISYFDKWSLPYYGTAGETFVSEGGALKLGFLNNRLKVSAPEFHWSSDYLLHDHVKYLALSTTKFRLPKEGSVMFSSIMKANVFQTYPSLKIVARKISKDQPIEYKINEGRQASAVLRMSNAHQTGMVFDWVVYGDQAFALTERTHDAPLYPANIQGAYCQVIKTFQLSSGVHNFAIRYFRSLQAQYDQVEYLIDGKVMTTIKNIGIPPDKQKGYFKNKTRVIDPSQGVGENLINKMTTMMIGHGLFSRVDVFPYQQQDLTNNSVTIPLTGLIFKDKASNPYTSSRLWGQGAIGFFYNFNVTMVTHSETKKPVKM
ncbi:MAG: hypothetical protein H0W50_11355 [Parachlamydiaceae bacterium]|nr:hypothetical protein [Parachlamydiaceae bacterium]